jgi:IMP dehydrogenase
MHNKQAITFDDILLIPDYNPYESRRSVSTRVTDKTEKLSLGIPIMTANMDTVTGSDMANFISDKGGIGVLHRFLSVEENVREFKKTNSKTFVSVGASDRELDRFSALLSVGATYFCVDVAHGHAEYVGKMIKNMRSIAGANICIMAGNVATYAGADYLASVGADIIKVGIGPGSVCTTRIKTGFGVPQLSAIQSCARINRSIIADGGIKTAGDIVKALAFGADFVMIGKDGVKYKEYRGMASQEAQESFLGQMPNWKTSEGVSTYVPYREDADNIIADIVGGIRSGLTYGGAATVNELQKKAEYMIVSPAGRTESLPHKTLK